MIQLELGIMLFEESKFVWIVGYTQLYMYLRQQNKCYPPPKGVYLPISKLHSILVEANLLAHNNKIKFVTAVKFLYRVLQFLTLSDIFEVSIYFSADGTVYYYALSWLVTLLSKSYS